MIPISLVTGFLGSGKTTFLKRVILRNHDRKIVYLINEFSPTDVDGHIIASETPNTVAIAGGSIFCRCKVTEFLSHLKKIPKSFNAPRAPVEGVVIEASGITNPKTVVKLLSDTKLDGVYSVASIISVVEPGSFLKLLDTLPAIAAQVEAANVVILNKTDLFDAGKVAETEAAVREINPTAEIVKTSFCRVDVDIFEERQVKRYNVQPAPCRDPNFERLSVAIKHPVDADRLVSLLKRNKTAIYRAKGKVPTEKGPMLLDFTPTNVSLIPLTGEGFEDELALIVSADGYEEAKNIAGRIEAGDFDS